MSKIIIGIHGLGNKPPKELLTNWWFKSICEGLKKINRHLFDPEIEIVYWADVLNDKPLNNLITDPKDPYYLDEPYTPSPESIKYKSHARRKKFLGFLEDQMDKIFLNEDYSSNFNFIYDMIFKKYFKELEIYYSTELRVNNEHYQSVKTIIRNKLADVLKKHDGKEIFLIAHSMGSIIAYDVCSFIVPDIKIDTLVTMGSPLGIPVILSKIAEELKSYDLKMDRLRVPENIQKGWFNFSDIEDKVAFNYNLGDDYDNNSRGVAIRDFIIANDYLINNERNPHKSYGYLRSPEFSILLSDFLERDVGQLKIWYLQKTFKLKQLMMKINFFTKGK